MSDDAELLEQIAALTRDAGQAILRVVERGFQVDTKADLSPVTEADQAAEAVILDALKAIAPGIPVIAEEEVAAGRIPAHGTTYFLVDPLDGTKEFVRGGTDYTVNIGLIEDNMPRLGAVYAPARDALYGGIAETAAWRIVDGERADIRCRQPGETLMAVASKSHFNQPTADYLEVAAQGCGYVGIGSSLKFCIVAEGEADIYPRLSPTSEWDTAAAHAVLLGAGGRVDGPDGEPLRYGKPAFLNRGFVATGGWRPPAIGPYLEEFSGGGDLPQGV